MADRPDPGIALAPVGRETLQDRVYAELRRALIGGKVEPGQVLTIQSLAASLATSTMPVREALGRLISEKALEALPNRSVRVPLITQDRLDDLLRARSLIEGETVAMAAARIKPRDIADLKTYLEEWAEIRRRGQPVDLDRELDLNQAFHFRIYTVAGSAVLVPMIESLWLQSGPYTRAAAVAFSHTRETDTATFHTRMVEALEAGDAPAARAALIADISRAFALLDGKIPTEETA